MGQRRAKRVSGPPRRFLKPVNKVRSKETVVSGGPSVSRFLVSS